MEQHARLCRHHTLQAQTHALARVNMSSPAQTSHCIALYRTLPNVDGTNVVESWPDTSITLTLSM
jgi:hypothetical protein